MAREDLFDMKEGEAETSPQEVIGVAQSFPVTQSVISPTTIATEAGLVSALEGSDAEAENTYMDITSSVSQADALTKMDQKGEMANNAARSQYLNALPQLLANPNIPDDEKRAAVDLARMQGWVKMDPAQIVAETNAAAPSGGTPYNDFVRTTAESMRRATQRRADNQAISNLAKGMNEPGFFGKAVDILALFTPIPRDALVANRLANATGLEGVNLVTNTVAPGLTIEKLRDAYLKLSPSERKTKLQEMATIIGENSGIFTGGNYYETMGYMADLMAIEEDGVVKDSDLTNFFNALDLIGVGAMLKGAVKPVKAAARAVRGTTSTLQAEEDTLRALERNMPQEAPGGPTAASSVRPAPPIDPAIKTAPTRPVASESIDSLRARTEEAIARARADEANKLEPEVVDSLKARQTELNQTINSKRPKGASPEEIREYAEGKQAAVREMKEIRETLNAHEKAVESGGKAEQAQTRLNKALQEAPQEEIPVNPIMAAISRAYNQSAVIPFNPRTAGGIAYETNPMLARNIHAAIHTQRTDEMAQATHGLTRDQALAKGHTPQIGDSSRITKVVPPDMNRSIRQVVADAFKKLLRQGTAGLEFTPAELGRARSAIVSDFSNAFGLDLNTAMSSVVSDGSRFVIRGVYTNGETGWLMPEHALDQARFAARNFKMDDSAFTLLRKEGDEYVPVDWKDHYGKEGDYAISLDADLSIYDHLDKVKWDDPLTIKKNWFDRIQTGLSRSGSITQHLFPADVTLPKRITSAFSVAEDMSNVATRALGEKYKNFHSKMKALSKDMQASVWDYIQEANAKELPYNQADVLARTGRGGDEAVREWRSFWDLMFDLENQDLVRSLNLHGYTMFKDSINNTQLYVKQYARNAIPRDHRALDALTGDVKTLTKAELDNLYNSGGYVAKLRSPEDFNGARAEFVVVQNTPQSYARKFLDTDKVLNKKEGYYQVFYKSPVFITNPEGKVVSVAGSKVDARKQIELMDRQYGPGHALRDDKNVTDEIGNHWQQAEVEGRLAQRYRGTMFSETVNHRPDQVDALIYHPAESAARATQSMATRLALRNTMETTKREWLTRFGHLVKKEKGMELFPTVRSEIGQNEHFTKEVADARTLWAHINYMENGYLNHMDSTFKNSLNAVADALGEAEWGTMERLVRQATPERGVSGVVKGAVTQALIFYNPLRQLLINANQGVRVASYNPSGFFSGRISSTLMDMSMGAITNVFKGDADIVNQLLRESGIRWSANRHNLVRGTMMELTDRSLGGVQSHLQSANNAIRKVGFDAGENMSAVIHMAAVVDDYKYNRKLDVTDARVRAEMMAEARAVMGNMNRAGDMPYNQNMASMVMAYMQVPHKFAFQFMNRQLPPKKRYQLLAGDMALWGLPTSVIGAMWASDPDSPYSQLPENVRLVLAEGLQEVLVNTALSTISGTNVDIDLNTSLNPLDMGGFRDMYAEMLTGGFEGLMGHGPVGNVFGFDAASRTGLVFQTLGNMFSSDDVTETDTMDVAKAVAKFSAGFSNYDKARMMWLSGEARDAYGRLMADDVSKVEAVAQAFGMPPSRVANRYEVLKDMNDTGAKPGENQAKKDVQTLTRILAHNSGADTQKMAEFYTKAVRKSLSNADDSYRVSYLNTWYAAVKQDPDLTLVEAFSRNMKVSLDQNPALVEKTRIADQYKQMIYDQMRNMREVHRMYNESQKGNE